MIGISAETWAGTARRRGVGLATVVLIAAVWAGAPAARAACPNEALREQQHSTFLPDCRAYEMVSPPEKNGGGVMTGSSKMPVAADGSAAMFRSLTAFGDASGMGVAVEYLAERSSAGNPGDNGWTTHAITPAQEPVNAAWVTMYYEPGYLLASPDLSAGVLWARNLTEDPFVQKVANLYARTDLRSQGAGTYTLMSPCSLCEATSTPLPPIEKVGGDEDGGSGIPRLAGASSDMSSVLFESTLALAPGSNAQAVYPGAIRNAYESDHGVTRLVSVIPPSGNECIDPECVAPSGGAVAGTGEYLFEEHSINRHPLSADGTRAIFTANQVKYPCPAGTINDCGELYLRELGSQPNRTIKINASERSTPEAPQRATFWDASTDLARIFFTSGEQLTETAGGGLYMFEPQAPAGHRLTLIGPSAERVYGVSEDGHYVYFTASTQLVAGEPALASGASGIYLWDDGPDAPAGGELRYIGELRYAQWSEESEFRRFEEARVSPDGQHLLFSSISGEGLLSHYGGTDYAADCEGYFGKGRCNELYLYDAQTNQLHCASCRPDGAPAHFDSTIRSDRQEDGASSETALHENRALSSDGRYVFFDTEESLVPQDTNGTTDVYEYDSVTNEVHMLSSGESADPSYFIDASANGSDAFIVTRGQLVGWDVDRAYDLYDVRVGGGFPEPPPLPPSCEGDACQPPPVVLSDATPGTLTFSGPGNSVATGGTALPNTKAPGKHKKKHKHRRRKHPKAQELGRHGKRNRGGHR